MVTQFRFDTAVLAQIQSESAESQGVIRDTQLAPQNGFFLLSNVVHFDCQWCIKEASWAFSKLLSQVSSPAWGHEVALSGVMFSLAMK